MGSFSFVSLFLSLVVLFPQATKTIGAINASAALTFLLQLFFMIINLSCFYNLLNKKVLYSLLMGNTCRLGFYLNVYVVFTITPIKFLQKLFQLIRTVLFLN